MKERSLTPFHGAERYNCAQSVLKSTEKYRTVDGEKLLEYGRFGGGRARDGLCGALFAAKQEMEHDTQRAAARKYFEDHAGSVHCREIRRAGRMSCRDCVAAAAELLEPELKKN